MNSMKGLIVSSVLTTAIFVVAVMSFFSENTERAFTDKLIVSQPIEKPSSGTVDENSSQANASNEYSTEEPDLDDTTTASTVVEPVIERQSLADLIQNDSSEAPAPEADIASILTEKLPDVPAVEPMTTGSIKAATESQTGAGGVVKVKPGDTLYAISRRTGVAVPKLISANGLTDPSKIRVGQSLRLQ